MCILALGCATASDAALSALTLALLLTVHVDVLHLMLWVILLVLFSTLGYHIIIIVLLHGHLVLEQKHLLDLLLGQLLVDHFLLRGEVVLFDLLAAAFDLQLAILLLTFLVHDFTVLVEHMCLLLLSSPARIDTPKVSHSPNATNKARI